MNTLRFEKSEHEARDIERINSPKIPPGFLEVDGFYVEPPYVHSTVKLNHLSILQHYYNSATVKENHLPRIRWDGSRAI
jgi:hypothetical protein